MGVTRQMDIPPENGLLQVLQALQARGLSFLSDPATYPRSQTMAFLDVDLDLVRTEEGRWILIIS
ncbi:hypothetical protein J6590_041133 [Homalodisca vitripennis]|nr:hypothetical protein J6590_041133 [Homalodisca vitripennis]